MWSAYAGRATNHIEGGKGTKPRVVKFQLRPDPLAKRADRDSRQLWRIPLLINAGLMRGMIERTIFAVSTDETEIPSPSYRLPPPAR